ncbi:MAG: purine-binding chemotaxis protein CheW [bacterium]|jgi:purine-binding chemotaxis protein CheW|nr:purine-binding chemotaxis protein CheW [bacterium]MBK7048946.1 purine-binding chemotaxis protein CheW [bacterium]MBK7189188.1 purine-binding chemotaxis protein CheW [bacterium]MBK7670332.1 purine-binding chemotaxis protein CheW [bacterium]
MATESTAARIAQAGKFLSFILGEEEYGLEILKVQEINGMMGITRVPRTPDYVRGVINLRGRVIPIVSLRKKFKMPAVADTEKTCIIVVQVRYVDREITMGIIVDEVSEVLNIGDGQIEPPPSFGGGMEEADFITGMGKLENKVVILLDIDRVMSGTEMEAVMQAAN